MFSLCCRIVHLSAGEPTLVYLPVRVGVSTPPMGNAVRPHPIISVFVRAR